MSAEAKRLWSLEEYLALERESASKHEYILWSCQRSAAPRPSPRSMKAFQAGGR